MDKQELMESIIEYISTIPNTSYGIDGENRVKLLELLNQLHDIGKE
jgi:CRISPR/Cas system-associated endonuclease Cas3-HD